MLRIVPAAILALATTVTPSTLTPSEEQDAREVANKALLSRIHAAVWCTVDADGEASCVNMEALKRLAEKSTATAPFLDEVYRDEGLDRNANALVQCGNSFAAVNIDVGAALGQLGAGLTGRASTRHSSATSAILRGGSDAAHAPVNLPGRGASPELGAVCGAPGGGGAGGGGGGAGGGGGGGGGSGIVGSDPRGGHSGGAAAEPTLQERAAEAWRAGLNARHAAKCGGADLPFGAGRPRPSVESGGGDFASSFAATLGSKAAEEAFSAFKAEHADRDIDTKTVERRDVHSDGSVTTTTITTVTMDDDVEYIKESTHQDAPGETGGTQSDPKAVCTDPGIFSDKCSASTKTLAAQAAALSEARYRENQKNEADTKEREKKEKEEQEKKEKEEAEKKKKEEEERKKAEEEAKQKKKGQQSASSPGEVGYDCAADGVLTAGFLLRCDDGGWQQAQCARLAGMHCADVNLVTPTPDGDSLVCASEHSANSAQTQAAAACQARGLIAQCAEGERCACVVPPQLVAPDRSCLADPRCRPNPQDMRWRPFGGGGAIPRR